LIIVKKKERKRKKCSDEGRVSEIKEHDEQVLGAKIKVWLTIKQKLLWNPLIFYQNEAQDH